MVEFEHVPPTEQERALRLLEHIMAGGRLPRTADDKLKAAVAALPLAAAYIETTPSKNNGTSDTLVIGMDKYADTDSSGSSGAESSHTEQAREETLRQLIGNVPFRMTNLRVYRDFECPPSGGSSSSGGDDLPPDATPEILRGGLALGGVGTLCLAYSMGRGTSALILSGHAVGSGIGAMVRRYVTTTRRPPSPPASQKKETQATVWTMGDGHGGTDSQMLPEARASRSSSVVGVVTANPSGVRASDASLALITDYGVRCRDHAIRCGADRDYHVTSYVCSAETPLGTCIQVQKGRSDRTDFGHIRYKRCVVRDTWGTLTHQVLANYDSQVGDSGAPVFVMGRRPDEVAFVGLHVGRIVEENGVTYSFYSPWEAIKLELGLPAPHW